MHPNYSVEDLQPGMLLLAEPFLEDPSFHRSVILLCEHTTAHSFGLVLNNKQEIVFDSFVDEKVLEDVPLFSGGPVDPTIMQFVHRRPDLIPDGVLIGPGIYWSGSFEVAIDKVVAGEIGFDEIKFFIGYSGWGAGQLEREVRSNAWILHPGNDKLVFDESHERLWRKIMYAKGGDFRVLSTYPDDPNLN
jgi:putative transcriptional regulator